MSTSFDAIVVGAGQAGSPLAGRLTAAGLKVALVERKLFGGTCVNTGCMPTKTLIASAHAAHVVRRAREFGIVLAGGVAGGEVHEPEITVDMRVVKARLDAVIRRSRGNIESWVAGMKGCTVFREHARFVGPHELAVGADVLTAEKIFLDVGGRATVPRLPGVDQVKTLTNTTILELDVVPEHLVVIGGSYVGLEFAQAYRRFGSRVTVVEKGPRLVAREDGDVSAALRSILEAEGIVVRTSAECIHFSAVREGGEERIAVGVDCRDDRAPIVGSHLLLAVGRTPNTADLGLDVARIERDSRGYIVVDDQLRTSAPGVWALGDCNGRGAFTHTSYNDFEIVAANLLDQDPRKVTDRITAYALYTDPPLGRVGMTEHEARVSGASIKVATRPMTKVGRAVERAETQGFMKVIVDAGTDAILGAHILGVGGDEAIHGILDTMYAWRASRSAATGVSGATLGGTETTLRRSVPIHPTVSELIPTMLADLT